MCNIASARSGPTSWLRRAHSGRRSTCSPPPATGNQLRPDLDLAGAGRAVFGSVLWNFRVLAGWSPPLGASRLRVLAGAFELANLRGEIAQLEGIEAPAPLVRARLRRRLVRVFRR